MLSVSVLENMTDLLEASGSEFGAQDVDDLNQFTEAGAFSALVRHCDW